MKLHFICFQVLKRDLYKFTQYLDTNNHIRKHILLTVNVLIIAKDQLFIIIKNENRSGLSNIK
jgi:hypothetical protein